MSPTAAPDVDNPPKDEALQLQTLVRGIAHDLRAPLRAIDGFAGKVQRQHAHALDADALEALERIQGAAGRMAVLVDRLVELVRVGSTPMRVDDVDLSMLAEWCCAELQDREQLRTARFDVQPGLHVRGDERLLKELLAQLCANAWRFSASRPIVQIAIGGHRRDDGVSLWVRDAGIGFDPAYSAKLFEPFQRLHGADEGAGAGLGLAIARQIVARHGGSLRAESAPDAGATFHVDLPDIPVAVELATA